MSVIIPTYKGSKYLSRAIESVLNQDYEPIEIIIIDDNEPLSIARRKTKAIINNYTDVKNIKYIMHDENKNGAFARNTGIKNSKGDYVCFLDDDDFYLPNRITKSIKKLLNNPSYDAVYCSVIIIDKRDICDLVFAQRELFKKNLLLNEMALGTGSNIFIKRRVLKKIVGFDVAFTRHQDLEFMLRLMDSFKVINLNEFLIVKGKNGTNNIPLYKNYKEVKELFFKKFEKEIDLLSDREKISFYGYHYSRLLLSALNSNKKIYIAEAVMDLNEYRDLNLREHFLLFIYNINLYNNMTYNIFKKINNVIKSNRINKNMVSGEIKDLILSYFIE